MRTPKYELEYGLRFLKDLKPGKAQRSQYEGP